MKYKLKKENKPTLTTFGKYKAVASHRQTIETKQILKEVCENNPISEGVVTAVVWKLAQVIKRHLREGDKVRLRDFGLLKLEIESEKVETPEKFKPRKHIKGVRLHFLPESDKGKPELYKGIKFEKLK
jgi:predicted histone-like DNA-binding protein